jgi:hypothetical protein
MSLDRSLMDKQFGKVNDLIAKYNRDVAEGGARYPGYAGLFPKVNPVNRVTVAGVGEWKDAIQQQFALEARKNGLDRRKAELDARREELAGRWKELADDGRPLDPSDPKVVSLRDSLAKYKEEAARYSTDLAAYGGDLAKLAGAVGRFADGVSGSADLANTRWARREGPRPLLAAVNARLSIDFLPGGRWAHSKDRYVFGTWRQNGNEVTVEGFTYTGEPPKKLGFRGTGRVEGTQLKLDVVEDPYAPDYDPNPTRRTWIFDRFDK